MKKESNLSDVKNENVWLMKGSCLERMKEIPEGQKESLLILLMELLLVNGIQLSRLSLCGLN